MKVHMKVYVASSWKNEYHNEIVQKIRSLGHSVYDYREQGFRWSEISDSRDKDGKVNLDELKEMLLHPVSCRAFDSDSLGVYDSDLTVLVLDSGKSAHMEIGYQFGRSISSKKFSMVVIPKGIRVEPELMYKWADVMTSDSLEDLTDSFEEIRWLKDNE